MASVMQGPRRVGQWLYLRPECIDEYKKCHAAVWPAVLEQIRDSNIKDCIIPLALNCDGGALSDLQPDSIYLSLTPRPTLFSSFKYVGNNFNEDMKRMAANPKVQEWWQMTDRMQESPVEGAVGSAKGPGWWGKTEEVFYME